MLSPETLLGILQKQFWNLSVSLNITQLNITPHRKQQISEKLTIFMVVVGERINNVLHI
jgi:hypothetical protein